MHYVTRNSFVTAPPGGGHLNLVTVDGELLLQLPVPEGKTPGGVYLDLCGPGQRLVGDEASGVLVIDKPSRARLQNVGEGHFESSANPAFRITPADRHVRETNQRLQKLEALEIRMRARETALERAAASAGGTPPAPVQEAAPEPETEVVEPLEE